MTTLLEQEVEARMAAEETAQHARLLQKQAESREANLWAALADVVRETTGAPSIILLDGQPYKVIPTSLADRLAALLDAPPPDKEKK